MEPGTQFRFDCLKKLVSILVPILKISLGSNPVLGNWDGNQLLSTS
jgi:hypothetical protein